MNTLNPTNDWLKFNCIYCGQHMECNLRLASRQLLCPACQHRIVIPTTRGGLIRQALLVSHTWDTDVPLPRLEIPTRYRAANVLARAA